MCLAAIRFMTMQSKCPTLPFSANINDMTIAPPCSSVVPSTYHPLCSGCQTRDVLRSGQRLACLRQMENHEDNAHCLCAMQEDISQSQ